MPQLDDLAVFIAVAGTGGFRAAARRLDLSASTVSETVERLETRLEVRLLHRTTRSVTLTEAGKTLADRLEPAMAEIGAALDTATWLGSAPRGTLRLNVPGAVMIDILPPIVERFLRAWPEVDLELVVEENFVDFIAAGCDAGIRYGESLAGDVIAVPVGPPVQRGAAAASPGWLAEHGAPAHPRDLLRHACIRSRFPSGVLVPWDFARGGEIVRVDPEARLTVTAGAGLAAIGAAVAGLGIVCTFENWLAPEFAAGRLVPVLEDWWPGFDGPRLYYSSRRHVPPALRAFIAIAKEEKIRLR
ncbi:MAG TPA: LysR family transcriptional regulator [Acidiphilium sp.]